MPPEADTAGPNRSGVKRWAGMWRSLPRSSHRRAAVRSVAAACAIAASSMVFAACDSGSDSKAPTPLVPVVRRMDVELRDFAFNPNAFEAPQGRVFNITAKNSGSTRHTLNVYKDAAFATPLTPDSHVEVAPGATEGLFVKFDAVATYYFRCEIHPQQMQGQITVKPSF